MDMNQDEIASMIIEARDNGSSTLSLHGKGLEVLPPEIGQLTSLIGLDLGLKVELPCEKVRNRTLRISFETGHI